LPGKSKAVFTTGEVAKICKMNVMTVNRRFDDGTLRGYKLPKSGVRRVPYKELVTFMKTFGIPLEFLDPYKRGSKILIVDDEPTVVQVLRGFIGAIKTETEFQIKDAGNGFEAGRLYEKFRPDLLVLDIMLPDIDGRDVARQIKAEPDCLTKILAISGKITDNETQELKGAGVDAFLAKPVGLETFRIIISELLKIEGH